MSSGEVKAISRTITYLKCVACDHVHTIMVPVVIDYCFHFNYQFITHSIIAARFVFGCITVLEKNIVGNFFYLCTAVIQVDG